MDKRMRHMASAVATAGIAFALTVGAGSAQAAELQHHPWDGDCVSTSGAVRQSWHHGDSDECSGIDDADQALGDCHGHGDAVRVEQHEQHEHEHNDCCGGDRHDDTHGGWHHDGMGGYSP
jgi:hypothetical protein